MTARPQSIAITGRFRFVLTPAGRQLFEFVEAFFSKVLETGAFAR
jgi:hypothetical protein